MIRLTLPLLALLAGCPVEPSDIPAEGQGAVPGGGAPGGDPGANGPPGQPPGEGGQPMGPGGPPGEGGMGGEGGPGKAPGQGGEGGGEGGQGGPGKPPGEGGQGGPGGPGGEGGPPMPAFTPGHAPTFDQIIEGDAAITLTGKVSGASKYQLEFLVVDDSSGRAAPRVIHMGIVEEPTFTLKVPRDYADPVWLVITADLTGDGPSEDDMLGGTEEALTFGTSDINLSFTLSNEPGFLERLPWYSKDAAGTPPEPPGGDPGGHAAPGAGGAEGGAEDGAP